MQMTWRVHCNWLGWVTTLQLNARKSSNSFLQYFNLRPFALHGFGAKIQPSSFVLLGQRLRKWKAYVLRLMNWELGYNLSLQRGYVRINTRIESMWETHFKRSLSVMCYGRVFKTGYLERLQSCAYRWLPHPVVSEFPHFSLTNVKFPWLTELN